MCVHQIVPDTKVVFISILSASHEWTRISLSWQISICILGMQVKLNRVCKSHPTIARFANRHKQERMVFFYRVKAFTFRLFCFVCNLLQFPLEQLLRSVTQLNLQLHGQYHHKAFKYRNPLWSKSEEILHRFFENL